MYGLDFERDLVKELQVMGCEVEVSDYLDHQEKTDCLITRINRERLDKPIRIQHTFRKGVVEKIVKFIAVCIEHSDIGLYVESENNCSKGQVALAILRTLSHLKLTKQLTASYILQVKREGCWSVNDICRIEV